MFKNLNELDGSLVRDMAHGAKMLKSYGFEYVKNTGIATLWIHRVSGFVGIVWVEAEGGSLNVYKDRATVGRAIREMNAK